MLNEPCVKTEWKIVEKFSFFTIRRGSVGVKSDSGRYCVMLGDAVDIAVNARGTFL